MFSLFPSSVIISAVRRLFLLSLSDRYDFFYFMNIISNLIDETKFLKYITPFAYTESADIITNGKISMEYLACGIAFGVIAVICAFVVYTKKDIS